MQDMLDQIQNQMRQYLKAYKQGVSTKRKRIESDKSRREHLQQEIDSAEHDMKRLEKKLKTDRQSLRALDRRIRDEDRDHAQLVQNFGQYATKFSKTFSEKEQKAK